MDKSCNVHGQPTHAVLILISITRTSTYATDKSR